MRVSGFGRGYLDNLKGYLRRCFDGNSRLSGTLFCNYGNFCLGGHDGVRAVVAGSQYLKEDGIMKSLEQNVFNAEIQIDAWRCSGDVIFLQQAIAYLQAALKQEVPDAGGC